MPAVDKVHPSREVLKMGSRVLYIDPFSGVSGDMFLGMLVDLGVKVSDLKKVLDEMGVDYELEVRKVVKRGIRAIRVKVLTPLGGHDTHVSTEHGIRLSEIYRLLDQLDDTIRERAKKVFDTLADAESRVHDIPKEKVHFHEVGALDAIIEIVGAVAGLTSLGVDTVFSGPVNVGSGFVVTQHGRYPVPAPATAELLKGVPVVFGVGIRGELVTPTGAAILKCIVNSFEPVSIRVKSVGYGAGDMELEIPNVLRGFLGETHETSAGVVLNEISIDDMNPELFGHTMEISSLHEEKSVPGYDSVPE